MRRGLHFRHFSLNLSFTYRLLGIVSSSVTARMWAARLVPLKSRVESGGLSVAGSV